MPTTRPALSSPIETEPGRVLAAAVFGEQLGKATRYVELLGGPGVERGLIGPNEADRLWDRHLLNCAVVAALIPRSGTVVDIGSGAGLPGIALALARPDLSVTLVESMARRTAFLDEVVAELELSNVRVHRARAEELASARLGADIVACRAVAPLGRLVGWAAPLLRPGGQLLAVKGAAAWAELAESWREIQQAGMSTPSVLAIEPATSASGAEWLPAVRVVEVARGRPDEEPDGAVTGPDDASGEPGVTGEAGEALAVVVRLNRGAPALSRRRRSGLG
jgi:16S rRNA (guanine527-N7)-methyltransferase